jgi:carbon storage regulator
MLVLSRQRDESIMIGDDVEITIVDVRGDKVRLGITAPKHIPVHRREIYDAIQREKAQKANGEVPADSGNGAPKAEEPVRNKPDKPERAAHKQE